MSLFLTPSSSKHHVQSACNSRWRIWTSISVRDCERIMRSVWTACQASALGRLPALVSSLPCYHDCLITSWQFPLRELDFGAGDPVGFFPGVLPRCPWTAVVLADGAGGGGALVHMTLPSEACDLLRRDPRLTAHLGNAEILQNTG